MGCHVLHQGIFLTPGIEPTSLTSPTGGFFPTSVTWETLYFSWINLKLCIFERSNFKQMPCESLTNTTGKGSELHLCWGPRPSSQHTTWLINWDAWRQGDTQGEQEGSQPLCTGRCRPGLLPARTNSKSLDTCVGIRHCSQERNSPLRTRTLIGERPDTLVSEDIGYSHGSAHWARALKGYQNDLWAFSHI